MGAGFSKSFIIFLFVAVIVSIAFQDWMQGLVIIGIYAFVKIIFNLLG